MARCTCSRDVKQRFAFLRRHSDTSPDAQSSSVASSHSKASKSPPVASPSSSSSSSSSASASATPAATSLSAERLQLWAQSMEHLLADDCKSDLSDCQIASTAGARFSKNLRTNVGKTWDKV